MKSIYILLTRSATVISKIIRAFTKDLYTHASVSFNAELKPLYSFSRKYILFPLPAGMQIESTDSGLYKKYDNMPCAVYELKVTDEIYCTAKHIAESMILEASKYRFNILGLFLCRMNIPFHRRHHYFCSEFVAEVLVRSNALDIAKAPSLIRPNDYTGFPELSCIFSGKMCDLYSVCEVENK
ncbi:MAG: hypothetical protein ACI4SF_01770 [Oscillospiraceae bacterium]